MIERALVCHSLARPRQPRRFANGGRKRRAHPTLNHRPIGTANPSVFPETGVILRAQRDDAHIDEQAAKPGDDLHIAFLRGINVHENHMGPKREGAQTGKTANLAVVQNVQLVRHRLSVECICIEMNRQHYPTPSPELRC